MYKVFQEARKNAYHWLAIIGLVKVEKDSEIFIGQERLNAVILSQFHTGSIHPALIFIDQRKGIPWIIQQPVNDRIVKYQIGLE